MSLPEGNNFLFIHLNSLIDRVLRISGNDGPCSLVNRIDRREYIIGIESDRQLAEVI